MVQEKTESDEMGEKAEQVVSEEGKGQCLEFHSPWQGVSALFGVWWTSTRGF